MSDNKILASRLSAARKENNYTQEEIAEFLNCGRATVTNYENGRRSPDYDTLIKLAKKYNVTTDYLLGLTEAETTDKDIRYICDYTGLSVDSVRVLNEMVMESKCGNKHSSELHQHNIIEFDKKLAKDNLNILNSMISMDNSYSLPILISSINYYLNGDLQKEFLNLTEFKLDIEYQKVVLFHIQQDFLKMIESIRNDCLSERGESNGND